MVARTVRTDDRPAEAAEPDAAPAAWGHRHLLDVDVLSREDIVAVLDTAEAMEEVLQRRVARTPALRGVTVFNLFYEPSTRTRASFELAGKVLGADVINMTGSGSSVEKGESLIDTVATIRAIGADVIVMRHPSGGAPYLAAQHSEAHVVNAGDGLHAHPTQALLDAFTLRRRLGDLAGKRIVLIGDIKHSRVARSNVWALTTLGMEVTLVGPRTLLPTGLNAAPPASGRDLSLPRVRLEEDLDRAIEGADAVMALRLQRERMQGAFLPSLREFSRRYQITPERLARAREGAAVLHPGPMNEGRRDRRRRGARDAERGRAAGRARRRGAHGRALPADPGRGGRDVSGDLLIRGGRLIDPGSGVDAMLDVLIREGRVAAVGADLGGAGRAGAGGGGADRRAGLRRPAHPPPRAGTGI